MHHAYLLIGDSLSAEAFLRSFWEEQGVELKGSPDFFSFAEPTFGIDLAREVAVLAARKAFGAYKIFFLAPETLTLEAQNALLKTFEEPVPGTHFFLSVRDEGVVIPTLRSRMLETRVGNKEAAGEGAKKFLTASLKDRLAFIKKFVDKEENLSVFLDNLLLLVKKEEQGPEKLKNLYNVRLVSDQRGPSARLILEHLATVL